MYPGGPERQPYAGVDFISPVRIYEFGFRTAILRNEITDPLIFLIIPLAWNRSAEWSQKRKVRDA
jgi:hypothetical protein